MTTNMESDHRNEFCWVLEVSVLRGSVQLAVSLPCR